MRAATLDAAHIAWIQAPDLQLQHPGVTMTSEFSGLPSSKTDAACTAIVAV